MLQRFFSSKAASSITKNLLPQKTTQQLCDELGVPYISGPIKIDKMHNFYKVHKSSRPATKKEILDNGKKLGVAPKKGW